MEPLPAASKVPRLSWLLALGIVVAACSESCSSRSQDSAAATGGSTTGGQRTSASGGNGGGGASGASGGSSAGGANASGGSSSGGRTSGAGGSATGGGATGGTSGVGGARTGGAAGGSVSTGGTSNAGGARTGGASGTTSAGSGGTTRATGGTTSGGASGGGGTTSYRACPTDGTACKIMPFGDSITDGYNGDTPGGYRVELFRRIHGAGKNITFVGSGWNGPDTVDGVAFPHNHEGHSGWTIAPTSSRSGISTLLKNDGGSQSVMLKYTPHIVLLMIGTNDAIDNYDMTNAPKRLGDLIDTIFSQLPNVFLVVAQPIPSRGDSSKGDDTALSDRIKTFNAAIPGVVKTRADAGKHIFIVDMFTPFNPSKSTLLEDQWHPNLQGYVLLGTQWYSVLQPLL